MDFFADTGGNTPYSPPNTDSFFVLKLQFDDGSDGTYFVEYVGHDPGGGGSGR